MMEENSKLSSLVFGPTVLTFPFSLRGKGEGEGRRQPARGDRRRRFGGRWQEEEKEGGEAAALLPDPVCAPRPEENWRQKGLVVRPL